MLRTEARGRRYKTAALRVDLSTKLESSHFAMFVLPHFVARSHRRPRASSLVCCDSAVAGSGQYAARILRDVYEKHHALPSSAGCAHELGRQAEAVRSDALRSAVDIIGGDVSRATVHHSVMHGTISALRTLKPSIVVLSLSDDPAWTGPLEAEAQISGYEVRWISSSTPDYVATAASDGSVLVALQVVSTTTGRHAIEALEFARAAGVLTIADGSNAFTAGLENTDQLGDVVVYGCGSDVHYGAVIALWSNNAWRKRSGNDVCVEGEPGTASLATFANALGNIEESRNVYLELVEGISDVVAEADDAELWSADGEELDYPVLSLVLPSEDDAEDIVQSVVSANEGLARRCRLRVLPSYRSGRGRRKAVRPDVLTATFSMSTNTKSEVKDLTRILLDCASS